MICPLFLGAIIQTIITEDQRMVMVSINNDFRTCENRNVVEEFYHLENLYTRIQ
jgi:hypothetical protein